ncbi:hypothetical protein CUMW_275140 [Citrus unshiu]|uniref:Uncharacterized protein n=1 Tax=Citrus unshiu TaxID=55188 RepID=A0A2H5MZS1_CITUN|nr:hypothetical protein CUMW_275140 [Citrus unshiu]
MNIKDKTAEIWDSLPNSEIEPNHRQEIVKQNLHALDLVLLRDIAFNFPSDCLQSFYIGKIWLKGMADCFKSLKATKLQKKFYQESIFDFAFLKIFTDLVAQRFTTGLETTQDPIFLHEDMALKNADCSNSTEATKSMIIRKLA